jgi:Fic family protein
MALAQDEKLPARFYSLSHLIYEERNDYYAILEQSQKRGLDVTQWLQWFLGCYARAITSAEGLLSNVLIKAEFWRKFADTPLNARQSKVLNRMLDAARSGFEGWLTTRKYAGMTKVSGPRPIAN